MLKVFLGKTDVLLTSPYNDCTRYSERLKKRVEGKNTVESYCHVAGETLLKYALQCDDKLNITEDENGKPRLADASTYFNLSDYGHYVACAISDGNVGVDVMFANAKVASVINRYASDAEKAWMDKEDCRIRSAFLWSVRESSVKLAGMGIRALSDVRVLFDTLKCSSDVWTVDSVMSSFYLHCTGFRTDDCFVVVASESTERALFERL